MKKPYNYSKVRIVCQGIITTCEFCESIEKEREVTQEDGKPILTEGYCPKCGRPLWKKSGEKCGYIVGYYDKSFKLCGKLDIKCKFCNTLTTI